MIDCGYHEPVSGREIIGIPKFLWAGHNAPPGKKKKKKKNSGPYSMKLFGQVGITHTTAGNDKHKSSDNL